MGNFQKNPIVAKVPNDSFNNRNMKICGILLGIFIVFISGSIIEAKNASLTVARNESTELIKKYFPDYVLMEIGELTPFARGNFERQYPNLTPSFVNADFDGDGFLDFALLLRNPRGKDRKTILTIFLHSNRNRFELAFYLSLGVYGGDVYIIPVESGRVVSQTESINVPREKVKLKNTAIELVYFEKSSVVYYWDDRMKKFESIWTSD